MLFIRYWRHNFWFAREKGGKRDQYMERDKPKGAKLPLRSAIHWKESVPFCSVNRWFTFLSDVIYSDCDCYYTSRTISKCAFLQLLTGCMSSIRFTLSRWKRLIMRSRVAAFISSLEDRLIFPRSCCIYSHYIYIFLTFPSSILLFLLKICNFS